MTYLDNAPIYRSTGLCDTPQPKLLSGEVEVPELDSMVKEVG